MFLTETAAAIDGFWLEQFDVGKMSEIKCFMPQKPFDLHICSSARIKICC